VFQVGWLEVGTLVVIALLVFGPDKLPQAASQAGRALRQVRQMAANARADLRDGLGPEFRDFDPADLNPKNFVRKHLIDDIEDTWNGASEPAKAVTAAAAVAPVAAAPPTPELGYGEIPPYDHEAT
jgi:sec-independent protein translocase protein TatB